MEDTKITFETAKLAKEKGFIPSDGITCKSYLQDGRVGYQTIWDLDLKYTCLEDHIIAVTQSLLQKWLREEYNIIVLVLYDGKTFYYQIQRKEWDDCITQFDLTLDQTYEEAYEIGLQEALKLI